MFGKASLLLDTDIFINYLRGQSEEAELIRRIIFNEEFNGFYSAITEIELYSVERMSLEQEKKIKILLSSLQRIELNSPVAQLAGRLIARYRKNNGLEMPDAVIAASAVIVNASLVSKNIKHFSYIPGLVLSPPDAYSY
ncbi:MAG: type II toxin-antitoxin system VapC family toxin [Bacillota bacterium]|nr:type II toxin-antitoxin system VapC family toxin [Bacillota bacterium]